MGTRGVARGGGGGGSSYRNPCLTMHQPWASLLVHGIKRVEGRSWPAPLAGIFFPCRRRFRGGSWDVCFSVLYRTIFRRAPFSDTFHGVDHNVLFSEIVIWHHIYRIPWLGPVKQCHSIIIQLTAGLKLKS